MTSFSSQDFSRSYKHDTFDMLYWLDISVLFLWAIFVSDLRPLEINKNLGLPLITITFTVNSHLNKHFYKYIYLFQIYSMKSAFY